MARFDYAYDREAAQSAASLGLDPSQLLSVIDANEATIEKAGVTLHSYTAPGHGHGIFELAKVLRARGQRRKLVDWVTRLIGRETVDDVHCQQCPVGWAAPALHR
jgi:hypothetical protein